jgi:hypothetical protein
MDDAFVADHAMVFVKKLAARTGFGIDTLGCGIGAIGLGFLLRWRDRRLDAGIGQGHDGKAGGEQNGGDDELGLHGGARSICVVVYAETRSEKGAQRACAIILPQLPACINPVWNGVCGLRIAVPPIDAIGRFIDDFQIGSACPI